jgi:DNA-binding MarR family transcriptional regulator
MRRNPILKIHQFMFLAEKDFDRKLLDDVGLSFSQCMILDVVYHNPEISQRAVAYERCITPAAVSRHIEALEELGFLTRHDREENKREHILVVTKQGERVVTHAERLIEATINALLEDVPKNEVDHMDHVLSLLLRRFRE